MTYHARWKFFPRIITYGATVFMVGTKPICGLPTPPCAVDALTTFVLVVPHAPERAEKERAQQQEDKPRANTAPRENRKRFFITDMRLKDGLGVRSNRKCNSRKECWLMQSSELFPRYDEDSAIVQPPRVGNRSQGHRWK